MSMWLMILSAFFLVLVIIAASMRPIRAEVSAFELQRRKKRGDAAAVRAFEREAAADDLSTILRVVTALFLVAFVLVAVLTFGWVLGVIIAVVVVLEYGALARLAPVRSLADKLYRRIEPYLLRFVTAASGVLKLIRLQPDTRPPAGIYSKEELLELVKTSSAGLSADDKRLITHGLSFGDRLVSEVMTPRSVVDTVAKTELLGPLTLDTLYKTGHSRLPVIDGDIDHVIGILYIQDLLVASAKKTPTAEQAMEQKVYYIREDQTLQHALVAFIKTHHHLFIVVNEYRETVGVLSLEDVIEALLGQEIIDEFDAHDDLRKVAERNITQNNEPKNYTDV